MRVTRRFVPAVGHLEPRNLQTSVSVRVMPVTGLRGRTTDLILIPPEVSVAAARTELGGSFVKNAPQVVVIRMVNSGGAVVVPIRASHVLLANSPVVVTVGTGRYVRNLQELKSLPIPLQESLRDAHKWHEWERFVNG
jgi:hypothetical protein